MDGDADLSGEDQEAREEQQDLMEEARFPSPLPAAGDRVFRKTNDDDRIWVEKTLSRGSLYMDGYKWAADVLFRHVEDNPADRDDGSMDSTNWLIYPIYFLYRHAIELSLKQMREGLPAKPDGDIRYDHNLHHLWNEVKDWVQQIAGNRLRAESEEFEKLIEEINRADSQGDAGRYELHRNGAETFKDHRPIDLPNLRETLNKMLNFLTWIRTFHEDQIQQAQQEDADQQWLEDQRE